MKKVYAFVDPGTRLTALRFWIPEWNRKHETTILKDDWQEMAPRLIELLDGWGTTTLAIEYNPNYKEPIRIRKDGAWGQKDFKGLLVIITKIREWALGKGITGSAIYPFEIMEERQKGNYCWRHYWQPELKGQTMYYCWAHKRDCGLTRDEKLSEWDRQVRHRDEVDCSIIERIFLGKVEPYDKILTQRQNLFKLPWKLIGTYIDNKNRNERLKEDGKAQQKKNEPKGFMF